MSKKTFSYSDNLAYGWNVMKANLGFFALVSLIWFGIIFTNTFLDIFIRHLKLPGTIYLPIKIISTIIYFTVSMIVGIGLIKIALSFCNEKKPKLSLLFNGMDCFWRYLAVNLLYSIIIFAGFLLFIVPGIIWGVKFSLCHYFVIDKGLGPIEALKASAKTTQGVKWQILGFGIICALINYAGILCLGVGVIAAFPTVIVAYALMYRQLAAQTTGLNRIDTISPFAQPPAVE